MSIYYDVKNITTGTQRAQKKTCKEVFTEKLIQCSLPCGSIVPELSEQQFPAGKGHLTESFCVVGYLR